jgi:hypothetical protein
VRIPSVPSTKREGRLRIELTCSASRQRMAGICPFRPAGIDVKRTLRTAVVDVAVGAYARLLDRPP